MTARTPTAGTRKRSTPAWSSFRRSLPRGEWVEAALVGLIMAIWSLAERGFAGGRWSDIPIIKSFVDPRLYRQDPFIWSLHDGTPAAYAYQLIAAFVRAVPFLTIDQALFLLYIPATVAALALLYRIGLRLTGDRTATLLFLALYVVGFRLVTIGSAILHSAETTPQTLALPFQLGSLYALLAGRLGLAGVLMGLAFNLHAPTTVYLAGALAVFLVLGVGRHGIGQTALSLALLALAGAPTIVGALLMHSDQLPLWALNLARTELATDISLTAHFSRRAWTLYNLVGLALIALALREAPEGPGQRAVLLFFLAVGLMCLGALLFFDLSLRTPISTLVARLQLPRAAWLLNVFGLLYLARLLAAHWWTASLPRPLLLLLLACLLTAPSDFVPLDPLLLASEGLLLAWLLLPPARSERLGWWVPWGLVVLATGAGLRGLRSSEFSFELSLRSAFVFGALAVGWGLYELLRRQRWGVARAAAPALALALLSTTGVARAEEWRYASAHRGGLRAAAEFQEWARTSTPLDSVFLILPSEPNNDTFYTDAERAIFLVRERANQAVYFREHSFEFERRVRALGIEQPLRYRELLDPAYRRLTEEQVRQLGRDFGVTHFVPARAGDFSFPIVYQSGGWTVYEVR